MKVIIPYGKSEKEVILDDRLNIKVLRKSKIAGLKNVKDVIKKSLISPIGTPSLYSIAKGKKNCCIVISDTTRPVPNYLLLPPIINTLKLAGMKEESITILIANGSHNPVPEDLFEELVGEEVLKYNVNIINHDAYDENHLKNIGKVSLDCPVIINKKYLESDLKICTGLIEPHFMAGYSGGRKSICPGIVGIETLKVFHGVEAMGDPNSKSCQLENNPVDKIAKEVALMAGCDFILNVSLNEEKEITGVFSGDIFKAHQLGCKQVANGSIVEIEEPVDIVITSNGGYPLDQNFYQTVKGLVEASQILKPSGVIIMVSECKAGVGKEEFKELLLELKKVGINQFLKNHSSSGTFKSDQWEVQKLIEVLKKTNNILLFSSLEEEDYKYTFANNIKTLEEGLERALKLKGDNAKIAVIPEGPYVVGMIKNQEGDTSNGNMRTN